MGCFECGFVMNNTKIIDKMQHMSPLQENPVLLFDISKLVRLKMAYPATETSYNSLQISEPSKTGSCQTMDPCRLVCSFPTLFA